MKALKHIVIVTLVSAVLILCGCETFRPRSHHRATSIIKFLYPNGVERVESPAIPVLPLPLKVGIAFVPVEETRTEGGHSLPVSDATVNEGQKIALMKEAAKHFQKYPFVKNIELIPSAYLRAGGSFENLDQLRSMFGVDVIALLSYDQVQFTDETMLSMTYWTVVGLYAVSGEKNDTRTMLDAVVYDVASRKMLFRAPGVSHVKGLATPVNLSKELRQSSEAGFKDAAKDLIPNLDFQLSELKDRIKNSPEEIKVVARPGYAGAAASGGLEILLLGGMVLIGIFIGPKTCSRAVSSRANGAEA